MTTLFLAACVPVQKPPEFRTPPIETKAGLSDLASVFAKGDENPDESEYMNLLAEYYECSSGNAWEQEYTDQQAMAFTIWTIGFGMVLSSIDREEALEAGDIDQYHEVGFEDAGDRPLHQMLLWAIEYYCDE
ncbi:MAG: hypothetical protein OXO48_03595 [Caldilineaceae bacterium]|nr:hypothetical protein [Caldilineaceae bacterium]